MLPRYHILLELYLRLLFTFIFFVNALAVLKVIWLYVFFVNKRSTENMLCIFIKQKKVFLCSDFQHFAVAHLFSPVSCIYF